MGREEGLRGLGRLARGFVGRGGWGDKGFVETGRGWGLGRKALMKRGLGRGVGDRERVVRDRG